jgi:hypothetical protein
MKMMSDAMSVLYILHRHQHCVTPELEIRSGYKYYPHYLIWLLTIVRLCSVAITNNYTVRFASSMHKEQLDINTKGGTLMHKRIVANDDDRCNIHFYCKQYEIIMLIYLHHFIYGYVFK